ncbi:LysR family transcriptional regulator [Rhodopseudomonas pseudopalustris]|uniref:Transcriptional regulator, LysR family n=1 Tax=Rhodopseudomonas pseudopalustris TaxID=1513892 RepID=A0A1H8M9L1_9BRAD|nr:LysR family transcriptional regulator [Rhodopseudomonas pseudopalustris]SEO13826.1 transcriptional regulator, LysR family [Rhodopseudomonas pseudopalustris]
MNLRQIRAFLLVAKYRSFTRAADELGLTQAAVSLMIREFEAGIGMPVFARSTRSIHITPVGQGLQPELERILSDLDKVFSAVSASISIRKGNVRVASLSSIAVRLLPSTIARCRQQHPAISISIRDDTSAKVLEQVKSAAADFGISTNDAPSTEIDFTPLFSEKFSVVCSRAHPFAKLHSIGWGKLCETPYIGMTEETGIGRLIGQIEQRQSRNLNTVIQVSQLSTVLGQLEENLGVALLPETAKPSPRHHALTSIPLSGLNIVRSIGILRRVDRPLSPAASAVADAIAIVVRNRFEETNIQVLT